MHEQCCTIEFLFLQIFIVAQYQLDQYDNL